MNRLTLLLVLLLAGCSSPAFLSSPTPTPEPCHIQAETFIQNVDNLLSRFDDVELRAESTSRIALSPVVGDMQSLRQEAEALEPPACAERTHELLGEYMQLVIEGYLAFMAQESETSVIITLGKAESRRDVFDANYERLQATPTP